MIRLPFRLPEWAPRTTWASQEAKVWASRITTVSNAWHAVERELVASGHRPSALQNVSAEQLPDLVKESALKGLVALPLSKTPRTDGYQSAPREAKAGDVMDYRCAITKPELVAAWTKAWQVGNDEDVGTLLGYPKCCRDFFQRAWITERWMDTTYPMFANGGADRLLVKGGVNMLWRWHGVRPVSHLPCSFECQASQRMAASAGEVMQTVDPQAAAWFSEILSWPIEWSSLHGIGMLISPVSRTTFATDALAEKVVVRYDGGGYPSEAGVGNGFPFRRGFKPVWKPNAAANGFSSVEAMDHAHDALLKLITAPYSVVLDLGCGDGYLLSKVACTRRVGVEINPSRAKLAKRKLDRVIVGDCTDHNLINKIIEEEQPNLIIAQRDRNPLASLTGNYDIVSYSYEADVEPPAFIHG